MFPAFPNRLRYRLRSRSAAPLLLAYGALAFALLRFTLAMLSGIQYDRGDFYATMPPAYSEQLNPSLWNNPEFSGSSVYQRRAYPYGPTQYLTIVPLVVAFDSYTSLARCLLIVYGIAAVGSALLLRQALASIRTQLPFASKLIIASTLGFFPLLQAVVQREFEVVVFAATVAGLYFLVRRRELIAGALFGYVTWFKLFPLLWLFLLALRRWFSAVAAFIGISAAIWLAAHVWLGLGDFKDFGKLAIHELTEISGGAAVCADFIGELQLRFSNANTTAAGIRYALCRFGTWYPWLPMPAAYFALLGTLLVLFLIAFWRFERRSSIDPETECWRRALEASVIVIMTCGVFYSHFYYLSLLAIVVAVLIARYSASESGWLRPTALVVAYIFLTVFVIPPSILSRVVEVDVFHAYMRLSLYFYGEMILIALVFSEYGRLSAAPQSG